ncbi:Alpha/beta hydrolase fold-3 [Penicillium cf. viridicatum]|uniref:Alpha/beta hydrolase fold-3 n=1 Tax=Penicillium cf. viridicatum TaxID=2972119 RepID=A0A9W9MGM9_9EURO|nr:Alpha/beta hydrolase fold-3 [Penicillium cf. viridicatum]
MANIYPCPVYDPELVAINGNPPSFSIQTTQDIYALRQTTAFVLEEILKKWRVQHEPYTVSGVQRDDLQVSVFRPSSSAHCQSPTSQKAPAILYIHPGGMIAGDRFTGIELMLEYMQQEQVVCITVEYRLAPEHPHPAALEDCYTTLEWVRDHSGRLGIDQSRLLIAGISAGGGLAAGVALLCRDRGFFPPLCGQILLSPMLDDRNTTVSSFQYRAHGVWSRESNLFAWKCLLNGGGGDHRGGAAHDDDVSIIYAAPARASDLAHLPPAYVECGSTDVFRDEDTAFASRLWEHGNEAELHIWPGGWHAFQIYSPESRLAIMAAQTRSSWLRRLLLRLGSNDQDYAKAAE